MTLIDKANKALKGEGKFFITKRGFYYRPDKCGYTDRPILAGFYSLEDAEKITHPNGPDGPRDGMSYRPESSCCDDDYLTYKEFARALIAAEELVEAVAHERVMPCQYTGLKIQAGQHVGIALARYRKAVAGCE